jgi:hypothetical protein
MPTTPNNRRTYIRRTKLFKVVPAPELLSVDVAVAKQDRDAGDVPQGVILRLSNGPPKAKAFLFAPSLSTPAYSQHGGAQIL